LLVSAFYIFEYLNSKPLSINSLGYIR